MERTCRSAGLLGDLKERGLLELFPASAPVSASTLAFVKAGYLDATKRAVAVQPVPGERPKRKTANGLGYRYRDISNGLKDRKKDHGPNVAVWGTGDTPMKEVLQLLKKEKYPFPANLELEYPIPADSNIVAEAKKCLAYVKSCLA